MANQILVLRDDGLFVANQDAWSWVGETIMQGLREDVLVGKLVLILILLALLVCASPWTVHSQTFPPVLPFSRV